MRLQFKLILTLLILTFICEDALAIDPFYTDVFTTPSPQTYWVKPDGFTVTDCAAPTAQTQLPVKAMSLSTITDFALRNNPQTRLAWYQAKVAAANVGIAKSAYLPNIDVGFNALETANIFSHQSDDNNSLFTYGPNLSFSYLLLDFGNRANTVIAAEFAQIAANLNQNNAIQQVILQVQQAYYQVLGFAATVEADIQSLKAATKSLAAAQALRANGMATIGDVYQAEASLAQAKLNLETAQGNYKTTLGQLATVMGVPADTSLRLLPLTTPPQTEKINQKVSALLQEAKRNRPDLLASEAAVRQSQAQLNATRASGFPTLSLSANLTPTNIFSNSQSGSDTTTTLALSFPLFTGFSYTYQVRNAQAQLRVAEASRDQLNQQVQFQVWQAYYSLQIATENIKTTAVLLKSSTKASEQAMGQYTAGVGNILTVLTTQTTLANARVQSIQAKLNWYVALAQLAAAIGTLNLSLSPGIHL